MEKTLDVDRIKSRNFKPFEFQNWPVYVKAVSFTLIVHSLCEKIPRDSKRGLTDQIIRASQSIPLNIAEGCARSTGKDKANFFRVAKGSAFECVAALDLLEASGLISSEENKKYQMVLAEIGKMLSGLIRYLEGRKG